MAGKEPRNADLHRDHRQRLRDRFDREGIGSFEDHNVLELLLFYSIRRRDTNEIAHLLLEEFGSITGVFNASYEQLVSVPGVGGETATFLKLVPAVCARYLSDMNREIETLQSYSQIEKKLQPYFLGTENERFVCMLMNAGSQILRIRVIDEGSTNSVTANIETIVREAIGGRAKHVIVAHSHPSGFAAPSDADLAMTVELSKRLGAVGIRLCDHVIFARGESCFLSKHRRFPKELLLFSGIALPE